jgi:hypothetical protein
LAVALLEESKLIISSVRRISREECDEPKGMCGNNCAS